MTYRQLVIDMAACAGRRTLARAGVTEPTDEQTTAATRCALRHLLPVLQIDQPDLFDALHTEHHALKEPTTMRNNDPLPPAVAEVLSAAADEVDRWQEHTAKHELRVGAGGAVFQMLYETSKRLYGWTAITHLEAFLGNALAHRQIQHWRETDRAVVSQTLREAAGGPVSVDLAVDTQRAYLSQMQQDLAAALGWGHIPEVSVLVREAAARIKHLEKETLRLRQELEEALDLGRMLKADDPTVKMPSTSGFPKV